MAYEREQPTEVQRNLNLLVQTGLLLAQNLDLQVVVQTATDAGLQLSGARFGAFFYNVVNEEGESYLLYTVAGVERDKFAQFPVPRNTAVFASTFEGKEIVRSGDITKDPRYGHNVPHRGMPQGHLPVRSYLAVPVRGQSSEVLGGLFYGHEETDVFSQDSEDLVATIAAQAAIAIENFQLRRQITRKIRDLEHADQERRQTSRNLSELAAIVESSNDAILSKDLGGIVRSWNQAASRIFGYSPEEILGKSILLLIPKELHSEEVAILEKIRAGERIEDFETVRLRKNGERLNVSLTISPLRDNTGNIVGASKILRDISSRKRIEASLIRAEKLAAAGRMASTIAHEVNNPLESVMNLIYLARTNLHNPEQVTTYLNAAESEVVRVSHIARQTLGFYRENGSAAQISLSDLAAETLKVYEPRCEAAGIVIKRNLGSKAEAIVRKGEIIQVISNLIANSIHAMPDGGTLTVSVEDVVQPDGEGVNLVIEDDGIGIPAEHLSHIFDAFFTTRSTIGTGIGLFIVKQFVEGHQGNIRVVSSTDDERHGTRMSIYLPLQPMLSRGKNSKVGNTIGK
jgi:PAS domain S-box-containing protein